MKFNSETPRRSVTIADTVFQVPAPYTEGHVMSGNEAAALNQLLGENIRNNMAKAVTLGIHGVAAKEADGDKPAVAAVAPTDTLESMQAKIDAYVAEYEFGVGSVRTSDPVEREAILIATGIVKDAAKRKGLTLEPAQLKTYVEKVLASKPEIRKQAEKVVKQRKLVGQAEMGDLLAELDQAA